MWFPRVETGDRLDKKEQHLGKESGPLLGRMPGLSLLGKCSRVKRRWVRAHPTSSVLLHPPTSILRLWE